MRASSILRRARPSCAITCSKSGARRVPPSGRPIQLNAACAGPLVGQPASLSPSCRVQNWAARCRHATGQNGPCAGVRGAGPAGFARKRARRLRQVPARDCPSTRRARNTMPRRRGPPRRTADCESAFRYVGSWRRSHFKRLRREVAHPGGSPRPAPTGHLRACQFPRTWRKRSPLPPTRTTPSPEPERLQREWERVGHVRCWANRAVQPNGTKWPRRNRN